MKTLIKFLVLIAVLLPIALFLSYRNGVNSFADGGNNDVLFVINRGDGVSVIADALLKEGLIDSTLYFKIYIWREKLESKLQAGEYILNGNMSIKDVAAIFANGKTLNKEKTIKIIEGWNIGEISGYLAKEGVMGGQTFADFAKKSVSDWNYSKERFDFLADLPPGADFEGFLFPDTYRIFADATNEDVFFKMLDNFDKKLSGDIRQEIESQGKSIFEIITMASIIQKEVRSEDDMKIVSGIFWNRLNSGQALESCATLAYILGENKPQYSLEDTKIVSPYNTYQNQGLPPGPISNPGLNAIIAAVYPTKTDYFYFLSRFDNGETVFSETYDDHLVNKAKYLK